MDWCRHYNWQILRLNQAYVSSYRDFEAAVSSEARKILFHEKRGYWERSSHSLNDNEERSHVGSLIYNFCAHWSITNPVDPTKDVLPKEVEFRVPRPIVSIPVLAKDLAQDQSGVVEKLVEAAMPSLKAKRRDPNKHLVVAICDLRFFDKKNASDFVKELQRLKSQYVPRQLKVRCDRSLLDRQIRVYQMHCEGQTHQDIAAAIQSEGEYFRNDRAAAYVTDVRRDIARIEKLLETAPLIKLDITP